ncbi:MAG: patatin family protein [Leptospirales bacterium]|jgi:predicted patatin/cPLA2 family phospholipase
MSRLPQFRGGRRKGRVLIVEGGGMRGAFTGGALAAMAHEYPARNFDLVIGVSSGSCAAVYYVTEPPGDSLAIHRFLQVWRFELNGSKLMSYLNLLRGRQFLDQNYLIDELFGKKYPVKRERLNQKGITPLYVVASNMKTLEPEYIKATSENLFTLLKAATSLPIATRGRRTLGQHEYTDGGVMDPLPVQAAIDAGYEDITVILTTPRYHVHRPIGALLSRIAYPRHKGVARKLNQHMHVQHAKSYELVNNPPKGVRMRVIDPRHTLPAQMLDTNILLLNHTVDMGMQAAYDVLSNARKTHHWWQFLKRLWPRFA